MQLKAIKLVNKNTYYLNRISYEKRKTIGIIIIISIFVAFGIIGFASSKTERRFYLKEVSVNEATVSELGQENGKYYIRVTPSNGVPVSGDDSWLEVKQDFYSNHLVGHKVGILLGKGDVYKKRLFSDGQVFEKTAYEIQDIYDSLELAKEANPQKNYTEKAKITKKKTTKLGDNFFVLTREERSFTQKVTPEMFNKYNLNDEVSCEFEAIGDLVKLIKVVGE